MSKELIEQWNTLNKLLNELESPSISLPNDDDEQLPPNLDRLVQLNATDGQQDRLCELTEKLKKTLCDDLEKNQRIRQILRESMVKSSTLAYCHPQKGQQLKESYDGLFTILDLADAVFLKIAKCYIQYLLDSCCGENAN